MKIYSKLIASALSSVFLLTSCYDLDLYPHDTVNSGVFWKTEAHAKQGLMGVYDVMKKKNDGTPTAGLFGQYYMLDALSDVAISNEFSGFAMGNVDARNGQFLDKWKNMYDGIAKANHAMQNIPKIEMSDEKKNGFLAEARFLRGLYYFHLLDFYGGVPIYDESWILSETFDKMLEPRSTAEVVREFIIKDLNFAETHLPYEWDKSNYGRATKAAAIALRGKVNLYNKNWNAAKTDFQLLVDNKAQYKCDLNANYAEMFKPDTDENPEMIFFISNSGGVGDANDGLSMAFYHGNRSTYGSGWSSSTLDPEFVDTYEMKDGKPFDWNAYIPGFTGMLSDEKFAIFSAKTDASNVITKYPAAHQKIIAAYADRDPRLNETCITPYSFHLGWVANQAKTVEHVILENKSVPTGLNGYVGGGGDQIWYLFRKFVPEADCGGQITNRANTPINFPLIRYADVLLMLAECYNELEDVDNAVKYINMVRTRPSTNMPKINSGPAWLEARSKAEVHKRLMHERAVEFAGEGVRFSDIRRWQTAVDVCSKPKKSIHGVLRYNARFIDRDYLWPIPGTEREKNDKLDQNPSW